MLAIGTKVAALLLLFSLAGCISSLLQDESSLRYQPSSSHGISVPVSASMLTLRDRRSADDSAPVSSSTLSTTAERKEGYSTSDSSLPNLDQKLTALLFEDFKQSRLFASLERFDPSSQEQADVILRGEIRQFKWEKFNMWPTPFFFFCPFGHIIFWESCIYHDVHMDMVLEVVDRQTGVVLASTAYSVFKRMPIPLFIGVDKQAEASQLAAALRGAADKLKADLAGNPQLSAYSATIIARKKGQAASQARAQSGLSGPSDVDRPAGEPIQPRPNTHAVVVGIEKYRDLPPVDFASRDATTVSEYFSSVLGVPKENIAVLVNERASKGDLEAYLGKWLKNRVKNGDEVFIYYGGHGAPNPKTGKAFLVPYDGNPSFLEETAYPLERLYASLNALPAKEVVVFLDSCFSGAGGRSVIAKGARPMVLSVENPLLASEKVAVLAAASGEQISSAYPDKRHGLFTYFLLKGLRGEGTVTKDGSIDLQALFDYVRPNVETVARRELNSEQIPQLYAQRRNPLLSPRQ